MLERILVIETTLTPHFTDEKTGYMITGKNRRIWSNLFKFFLLPLYVLSNITRLQFLQLAKGNNIPRGVILRIKWDEECKSSHHTDAQRLEVKEGVKLSFLLLPSQDS